MQMQTQNQNQIQKRCTFEFEFEFEFDFEFLQANLSLKNLFGRTNQMNICKSPVGKHQSDF
jgi:hypothetical protein